MVRGRREPPCRAGRQRRLRRPEEPGEQSIPLREVAGPAGGCPAGLGQSRRQAVEVLVRPGVVVPTAEEGKVGSEVVGDAGVVEPGENPVLERAEEAQSAGVGCRDRGARTGRAVR